MEKYNDESKSARCQSSAGRPKKVVMLHVSDKGAEMDTKCSTKLSNHIANS